MSVTPEQKPAVYVARDGDVVRDRDKVFSVWLGNPRRVDRHLEQYSWFYQGCPWGPPLLELLHHTPTAACIGTTAAGRRRMLWNGLELRAGVLVDLEIGQCHRTVGPVLILQTGILAAAETQFDFLYGLPNTKASLIMARVGYGVIGQMRRYSRILRHEGYLGRTMPQFVARYLGRLFDVADDLRARLRIRHAPQLKADWCDRADASMDQLWHESEHGAGLMAIRDAEFLRWRFDALPGIRTRYLCLREKTSGSLRAWFACEIEKDILHVRDFWARDAANGIDLALINALVATARRQGHTAISLEYAASAPKLAGWLAAGFIGREQRPVIFHWLGAALNQALPGDFHLTAADEC